MKSLAKIILASSLLLTMGLTNQHEVDAAKKTTVVKKKVVKKSTVVKKKAPKKIISNRNIVRVGSKFKDGRFNTMNLDASQSYRSGLKLWTGDTVERVIIRNNVSFDRAARESDNAKYRKAQNASLRNQLIVSSASTGSVYAPMKLNYGTQEAFNKNVIFNNNKFNQDLLKLVNTERRAKGLRPLSYSSALQRGADTRSTELAQYGHISVDGIPHVRLNKARFSTAFDVPRAIYTVGENSAMNFFRGNPYEIVSEKYMAEKFFAQWKASSGHYKNMMRSDYKKMAVSIKISQFNRIEKGRYSYIFGTQAFSR
ncbi:CAP domain-containing protein [Macrococcus sp. DPC7161]|uniref:CAP domain-containing protein n=1 Tax=Macrococcus sp. DPC7161 TaxID=2507060 RepID=UPI00100A6970|nr:CAP domain-containing protein [Macrococcus sp. DPC7161]RXK18440.1 CAP domain-containing protein [Macrococcus sp. DPC7161]